MEDGSQDVDLIDKHINNLNANRDRISIAHLSSTQSITSSFAEFETMLMRTKFDIIILFETWLKNNPLLLNHVTIPRNWLSSTTLASRNVVLRKDKNSPDHLLHD